MAFTVRSIEPGDADGLGQVHVRAWQAAYRGGLMPDEYLDGLSAADRAATWRQALANEPRPKASRLVAVADDDTVAGFSVVGPAVDDPESEQGELYVINVDPDHWGQGAAELLFIEAVEALRTAGFTTAILWVHPDNRRACRFYEKHGWTSDGVFRDQEVLGITVPELRYSAVL